jgi:NAD-dependent SIR2 family protein deacetylase
MNKVPTFIKNTPQKNTMSRCTADLEFLQCDMCQTYFHKDIFCPHRRECKGKDSKELKKGEAEAILKQLDKEEDCRLNGGGISTATAAAQRSQLSKIAAAQDQKQRTQLANEWADKEDEELKRKINKKALDDALAFLDS